MASAAKALGLVHPVLRLIVGDEFFAGLARTFWRTHPPHSGNLNECGEGFAAFLAQFEPVRELPYLPDVVRLELQVHRAYGAADHRPVSVQVLAGAAHADLAARRLRPQAALALFASAWPVASIWQQHQADHVGPLDIDLAMAERVLVFRDALQVRVQAVDAAEFAFWWACQEGCALAEAIGRAIDADPAFDPLGVMQRAFMRGLVVAFE